MTHELTAERLRELLHYDPITGIFTRKVDAPRNRSDRRAGSEAGSTTALGYIEIGLIGKRFLAHRLAFLYMTGEWPREQVDHVNGKRSDNAWANLRPVDNRTNIENRTRPNKNNSSGWLGCHQENRSGKWVAQIMVMRRYKVIGRFQRPEDAYNAYVKAKRELHRGCTL